MMTLETLNHAIQEAEVLDVKEVAFIEGKAYWVLRDGRILEGLTGEEVQSG